MFHARIFIAASLVSSAFTLQCRAAEGNVPSEVTAVLELLRNSPDVLNNRSNLLSCEYTDEWANTDEHRDVEKAEIGRRATPHPIRNRMSPKALFGRKDDEAAFCSAETQNAIETEQKTKFKSGEETGLRVERSTISFPTFSKDGKTAFIVMTHLLYKGYLAPGNPSDYSILPAVFVEFGIVCKKRGKSWHISKTIELGVS